MKLLFFIILLFITVTTYSQIVPDKPPVVSGTGVRDIPKTEPIIPQPPESNKPSLPISKKLSKEEIQPPEDTVRHAYYSDTILTKAYRNSLLTYYRSIEKRNTANAITFDSVTSYYSWALKNRQKIIRRQQTTGSIIFIIVISLVLSGLLFSAIQFYIAFKNVKRKNYLPDTSFKASLTGVEVSSSVLGVIILTLSIVFFYLYLVKVYPLVSL